jgi:hypothetical protein
MVIQPTGAEIQGAFRLAGVMKGHGLAEVFIRDGGKLAEQCAGRGRHHFPKGKTGQKTDFFGKLAEFRGAR